MTPPTNAVPGLSRRRADFPSPADKGGGGRKRRCQAAAATRAISASRAAGEIGLPTTPSMPAAA